MKQDIKILGDYVRKRLEAKNIPVTPYILLENVLCLVIASKISFHLPMTEIPVTLQSVTIVLIGVIYGVKSGAMGVLLYLLLGVAGIPVFSGSTAGLEYFSGNTGGFLVGFLPAVIVAGMFANYEWDRDFKKSVFMLFLAQLVILACGILWMQEGLKMAVDPIKIIQPLLPGLALKTVLGAAFLKMCWTALLHVDPHGEQLKN